MRWIRIMMGLMLALAASCGAPDAGPAVAHVDTEEIGLVGCGSISRWICYTPKADVVRNPDGSETMTVYAPSCYPGDSTGPCQGWFESVYVEGAADAAARAAEYQEVISQICEEDGIASNQTYACVGAGLPPSVPILIFPCAESGGIDDYCRNNPWDDEAFCENHATHCQSYRMCTAKQRLVSVSCPAPYYGGGGARPSVPRRHSDAAVGDAIEDACEGVTGEVHTRTGARISCS